MKSVFTPLVLTFFLVSIVSTSFSQSSWQWGQRWGGAHDDGIQKEHIYDMEVDYEGNVYISTSVTSDFYIAGIDSTQKTFGEDDLLLISKLVTKRGMYVYFSRMIYM